MVLHFKLRNGVFPHLHFLWLKDHALPIVEWAGNSSQALVSDISCSNKQLRNEPIIVALLSSRAEIILFSTESSSWTEVRQLLSEGPSLKSWQCLGNDDSFPNDPRLEIQNWNPQKEHKRAHNLMPSFMKGLLSRQCHCTSSQVSSGRSRIGQKHAWLMFLTWSYTTWVFSHLKFLLHRVNALTLAKWAHSESGGIPNGILREHGLAGNFIFRISACPAVCFATTSIAWKGCRGTAAAEWAMFNSPTFQPCQNHLIFPGNALTIAKRGGFFVWQLWPEPFAWLFWTTT